MIEILVTLVIIGAIAAALLPMLNSGNSEKADLAAEEVASAIRYARAEELRTGGQPFWLGLNFNTSAGTVGLTNYTIASNNGKASASSIPVLSPLDRKPYTINLPSLPFASGSGLGPITFGGAAQISPLDILFDASGVPNSIFTNGKPAPITAFPILISVTNSGISKIIQIDSKGRATVI